MLVVSENSESLLQRSLHFHSLSFNYLLLHLENCQLLLSSIFLPIHPLSCSITWYYGTSLQFHVQVFLGFFFFFAYHVSEPQDEMTALF